LSLGSESSDASDDESNSTVTGVALILLSLIMDGITAGLQKRLKHQLAVVHLQQPTTYDFLLYTSTSMFLTALFVAIVLTNDLRLGYQYVLLNPGPFQHALFMVCLCSVIGQSFVFYLVAQFDPLVCSTVTTTRKISSVVWSIHAKGHVLSQQGACGLALAMAGIALELRDKCHVTSTTISSSSSSATTTLLLPQSLSMKQLLPVSSPTIPGTNKTGGVSSKSTSITPYSSSSRRNSMTSTTACNSSSCSEDSEDE
jgi:solute carrier family 35 (UDP-galactose transporter), member B1